MTTPDPPDPARAPRRKKQRARPTSAPAEAPPPSPPPVSRKGGLAAMGLVGLLLAFNSILAVAIHAPSSRRAATNVPQLGHACTLTRPSQGGTCSIVNRSNN